MIVITHLAVRIVGEFKPSRQKQIRNKLYGVRLLIRNNVRKIEILCVI